jgi:probable F420-dependent oxidoreductase
VRFHQSVAFLESEQLLDVCRAADQLGYSGITVSDHVFFPKELESRYPYAPYEDGRPIWDPETNWPDTWCLISAMAAVTQNLHFTTSVYIAPARDLVTLAKAAGTAAFLSNNRVHMGVGVGWCKEEFELAGQDFHNRGKRLDDMIPALRALWQPGWVEYHGTHYDVPAMQMNPAPTQPVPIYGGGHSEPALRRTARLCDGWCGAGPYTPEDARNYLDELNRHRKEAGREGGDFPIYLALMAMPEVGLFHEFEDLGVTDMLCAPWMLAARSSDDHYESPLEDKLRAIEQFADDVIAKM